MNEFETPIDQLRPISTNDKSINPNSLLDYNELLNIENHPNSEQLQHLQNNQPQIPQLPQQQLPDLPQQQLPKLPQQLPQQLPRVKESTDINISGSLNNFLKKDYIFLIIAISLLFSDNIQNLLFKFIPNFYNQSGKLTFSGLTLHSIVIVIGLHLSKHINIKLT